MGDVFLEQIVKKRNGMKERMIQAEILLGGIVIFIIAILFVMSRYFGPFALLVAVGALYFAWYLITGLNLEFEYIYTNGEIDIDKISAKRKRKRLTTVRVSNFTVFEIYDHAKYKSEKFDIKYYAGINPLEPNSYCAVYHSNKGEKCLLVFNPEQRLIDVISAQVRKRVVQS